MSSAICFNLDQSKVLSSGNGLIHECALHKHYLHVKSPKWTAMDLVPPPISLTLSKTTKFKLFQNEIVCRRQF